MRVERYCLLRHTEKCSKHLWRSRVCVCVCVCIYIYIYINKYIFLYIYIYISSTGAPQMLVSVRGNRYCLLRHTEKSSKHLWRARFLMSEVPLQAPPFRCAHLPERPRQGKRYTLRRHTGKSSKHLWKEVQAAQAREEAQAAQARGCAERGTACPGTPKSPRSTCGGLRVEG